MIDEHNLTITITNNTIKIYKNLIVYIFVIYINSKQPRKPRIPE